MSVFTVRPGSCNSLSPNLRCPHSTITYDTLVRAGVKCTSAFVPAADASASPPYAIGSRGIKIVPDEQFSPQAAVPVRRMDHEQ